MSENIEKFGKPGEKKRGKLLQAMPGIITIIHAGLPHHTEPIEVDLLSPTSYKAVQLLVSSENSDIIDLAAMHQRRHTHTYEIGVLRVVCSDDAQRSQFLSYFKQRGIVPKLLMPYEPVPTSQLREKIENMAVVKEAFTIGAGEKLLYRIGVGKTVQFFFWPSSRTKIIRNA